MRFRFAFVTLALLLPAVSYAQSWEEFRPSGGGFRVEMPGKPQTDSEKDKSGSTTYRAIVPMGKEKVFMVMYGEKDADAAKKADTLIDAVVKSQSDGKKLLNMKREKIGNYPSVRMSMSDSDNDHFDIRVVIAEGRLIQAIYVGAPNDANARRFLDSLALTE